MIEYRDAFILVSSSTTIAQTTTQSTSTTTTKTSTAPVITTTATTSTEGKKQDGRDPFRGNSFFFIIYFILLPHFLFFLDLIVSFGGRVNYELSSSVETTIIGPDNIINCHIADLPEAVGEHSTIKTEKGIISCGGFTDNGQTNKCYLLSHNNSWTPFYPMNERRSYFSMVEGNGKLFAVGGWYTGDSMEWIDLQNGESWVREDLPFVISRHCMTWFNSSHAILTGGWSDGKVSKRSWNKNILSYFLESKFWACLLNTFFFG